MAYAKVLWLREHSALNGLRQAPYGKSAGMRLEKRAGQITKGLVKNMVKGLSFILSFMGVH